MVLEQAPEEQKYSESGEGRRTRRVKGKGDVCLTGQCCCRLTHLGGNGQASQGVPVQNVSASIVNHDVRLEFIQGSLHVGLHLLQVLAVLCAPLQLHLAFYGT